MISYCEKWLDVIVKVVCLLALFVQLGFNLQGFFQPKFPTTLVKDLALKDLEDGFPLVIKICPQPGFDEKALYEVGYSGLWQYFKGKSRFNKNVFGWAGHTSNNTTWGNVEKTFEKVRINAVTEILDNVNVKLNTGEYLSFSDEVRLERVNYPFNCYTLDLTRNSRLRGKGVKKLDMMLFTDEETFKAVHIQIHGRTLVTHRNIFDHTVFTTGDALTAKAGEHKKFVLRIEENIFVEEDESKNCEEYPNSDYASYRECDDNFTRSICSKAGLVPVWMAEQLENVTFHAVPKKSGKSSKHRSSRCAFSRFSYKMFQLVQRLRHLRLPDPLQDFHRQLQDHLNNQTLEPKRDDRHDYIPFHSSGDQDRL